MQWWWLVVSAILSSLFTLIVVGLWLQLVMRPSLLKELEGLLEEQGESASKVIAKRVEEAVKQGVLGGVKSLPSRDVLHDTTRNFAKTGVEIVEDRLGNLFKTRRNRD